MLDGRSTCPALPESVETGALDDLPPARYLLTVISTLASADGAAHPVRCGIFADDGVGAGISGEVQVNADGAPQQMTWSAIETVQGGDLRVRCQVQVCGGESAAAVRVFDLRIAATPSE